MDEVPLIIYNYNSFNGQLDNSKIVYSLNSSHNFTLPKGFKAEISGSFKSPSLYGFHVVKTQSAINVGVQKALLNKKARLSLNVNDLLNTMQWSSNMYLNDINFQYYNLNSEIKQLI